MAVTSVPVSDTLNVVVDNGFSVSGAQLTLIKGVEHYLYWEP